MGSYKYLLCCVPQPVHPWAGQDTVVVFVVITDLGDRCLTASHCLVWEQSFYCHHQPFNRNLNISVETFLSETHPGELRTRWMLQNVKGNDNQERSPEFTWEQVQANPEARSLKLFVCLINNIFIFYSKNRSGNLTNNARSGLTLKSWTRKPNEKRE